MQRIILGTFLTLTAMLATTVNASADVYIRAPFVRVQVGGSGTHVRAPFVNIFSPRTERVLVMPEAETAPESKAPQPAQPEFKAPAPEVIPAPGKKAPIGNGAPKPPPPAPEPKAPPAPKPLEPEPAPAPGGLEQVLTLEQFVDSFQPKAGNYEVTFLNPVSRKATTVQFSLPEGTPRRVQANGNQIEFDYGARKYVRIRFDRDGAEVVSR